MSFAFEWPRFSEKFHADTMQMLDAALNKGNKPPIIEDRIEVVELEMGTQPPELEIRDIGELTMDQFRGIFKLSYAGDAHIVLRTKVQANPLTHKKPGMDLLGGSRGILAAQKPLVVPMLLRLSNFRLNAYIVLVVSKQKGITLVFKTDPLQNVDVNSTFDSIAVIQKYIQKEIEGQLREMFREDLPVIIHKLSQRWIPGNAPKIEAPYLRNRKDPTRDYLETMSAPGGRPPPLPSYRFAGLGINPHHRPGLSSSMHSYNSASYSFSPPASTSSPLSRPPYTPSNTPSTASITSFRSSPIVPPDDNDSTFPEIENYDPTYGMRPEGLPAKSAYGSFGKLWQANRGLADLNEENKSIDDDIDHTETSFDPDWDEFGYEGSVQPPSSVAGSESVVYETIPAVGGGTVTRPRVYHSQSRISTTSPSVSVTASPLLSPSFPFSTPHTPFTAGRPPVTRPHSGYFASAAAMRSPLYQWSTEEDISDPANPYRADGLMQGPSRAVTLSPLLHTPLRQELHYPSPESSYLSRSSGSGLTLATRTQSISIPTPPASEVHPDSGPASPSSPLPQRRKGSISHSIVHPYVEFDAPHDEDDPYNINHGLSSSPSANHPLRPGLNSTVQLSTLSHSNHTLSPFTRSVEHFTVRSVPHHKRNQHENTVPEKRAPVKARRKRMYRIGGGGPTQKAPLPEEEDLALASPGAAPSEFSEVDHYFADTPPTVRHRASYVSPA